MVTELTEKIKSSLKDAAKKLTGFKKRAFMAQVTIDYFNSSPRQAETELGWSRQAIATGLKELETGIICVDNYRARGRKKTEELLPNLEADIKSLVEMYSQADPKFQSTFAFTKISARAVREALKEEKGYRDEQLPSRQTIGDILNRMGYSLKKTQKIKPLKKIPETEAIFANVAQANQAADNQTKSLRISLDSKAKVKIGNLSREGKARYLEPLKADDHDSEWRAVLVPLGILDMRGERLSIYFGQSAETSDFVVDCLELWWQENQAIYPGLEELVIDLDGGAATRSNRTQFIKRMVEFAQKTQWQIRLIYYPPYHSKYNPIERCWSVLENYWNGAILDSIDAALNWASNMTWKGIKPLVNLVEGTYEKGVKVLAKELEQLQPFWQRSETLPKWDVTVLPS
ncbi:MAG: ISAzo13 family transposase [Microcystis aeruginosa]